MDPNRYFVNNSLLPFGTFGGRSRIVFAENFNLFLIFYQKVIVMSEFINFFPWYIANSLPLPGSGRCNGVMGVEGIMRSMKPGGSETLGLNNSEANSFYEMLRKTGTWVTKCILMIIERITICFIETLSREKFEETVFFHPAGRCFAPFPERSDMLFYGAKKHAKNPLAADAFMEKRRQGRPAAIQTHP